MSCFGGRVCCNVGSCLLLSICQSKGCKSVSCGQIGVTGMGPLRSCLVVLIEGQRIPCSHQVNTHPEK